MTFGYRDYLEHMERVNGIYSRGPDPESLEWKTQYQERLKEEEFRRNAKAQVTRAEYVKKDIEFSRLLDG